MRALASVRAPQEPSQPPPTPRHSKTSKQTGIFMATMSLKLASKPRGTLDARATTSAETGPEAQSSGFPLHVEIIHQQIQPGEERVAHTKIVCWVFVGDGKERPLLLFRKLLGLCFRNFRTWQVRMCGNQTNTLARSGVISLHLLKHRQNFVKACPASKREERQQPRSFPEVATRVWPKSRLPIHVNKLYPQACSVLCPHTQRHEVHADSGFVLIGKAPPEECLEK